MKHWTFEYTKAECQMKKFTEEEVDAILSSNLIIICRLLKPGVELRSVIEAFSSLTAELASEPGFEKINTCAFSVVEMCDRYITIRLGACERSRLFKDRLMKIASEKLRNMDVLVHIDDSGIGRRVFDSAGEEIKIPGAVNGQTYYVARLDGDKPHGWRLVR